MKQPLMREFQDRQVRALRDLGNSLGKLPKGSTFRVSSYSNRGLDLVSEPCSGCGLRLHLLHVQREDVELLPL